MMNCFLKTWQVNFSFYEPYIELLSKTTETSNQKRATKKFYQLDRSLKPSKKSNPNIYIYWELRWYFLTRPMTLINLYCIVWSNCTLYLVDWTVYLMCDDVFPIFLEFIKKSKNYWVGYMPLQIVCLIRKNEYK